MIITCVRCLEKLVKFGGLLFSPPNQYGECQKLHLCQRCYHDVYNFVQPRPRDRGVF